MRRLSARTTLKRKLAIVVASPRLGSRPNACTHQPADGMKFLVAELGTQRLVEIGDLGLRLHPVAPARLGNDVVLGFVEVILVLDVADDLLQHVLDGDQARHAAIFVDDDGDMIAIGAKVAQEHIEPLGFRHEHGGAQGIAQVERFRVGVIVEQFLGEQDADNVVLVLADDGEARVASLQDKGDELVRFVVDRNHVHLGAWNHDVAHRHFGNLQRALR